MRLPKAQSTEERPFLTNQSSTIHNKKPKSGSPKNNPNNNQNNVNNNNINNSHKYHNNKGLNAVLNVIRTLWANNLIRWLLLVAVLLVIFVSVSNYVGQGSQLPNSFSATEIPELDFNLANLVSASIGLSNLAAEKIIEIQQSHSEGLEIKGQTIEGVDEPVTLADKASNNIIVNGFETLFSHSKAIGNPDGHEKIDLFIISEEAPPKHSEIVPILEYVEIGANNQIGDQLLDPNRISIIIDPLDATKEFTEETDADGTDMLPYVTILICIVQDEKPIAGIINRPFVRDENAMWAAVEAQALHGVNKQTPEALGNENIVTVSRSHAGAANDIVRDTFENKVSLPAGGAGYKSWLVLTGQADAYIHVTAIKSWDICAGHALLKAVGGDLTDKSGEEMKYKRSREMADNKFQNGLIAALDDSKIGAYAEKLKDIQLGGHRRAILTNDDKDGEADQIAKSRLLSL